MPTSYTSLLGLALPVTGELSGTWGDTVNSYITQYVDAAVAGAQTISGTQTAVTLSVTNGSALSQAGSGATGSAQYQIINCTGNPASALTVTVPSASKVYLVLNNTSTSQTVTVKGAATTGVTVAAARCALIAWNGTDFELVATDDASKMNGVLAAVNGGTGQSSYAVGDILYASTTTALSKLADVATGNALISGGVGVAPSYGKIGLTTHVSGTLPVANGGTNITSYTTGDILYASASGTLASLADVATGNAIISGGVGVAPSYGKIGLTTHVSGTLPVANGGTGVTTSTGSGSVVLSSSPALTTPNLGTPSAATLTNATGLPLSTGVTGTLPVANGGTGQTSYTDGQLLIGNTATTSLSKATLTAGSGVTITNGNGTITIAATGSGGTVTSVGATSPVASSGGNTPTISLNSAYGDTLNPYASKTANFFLAAPNGAAGAPTFRAIVAADVPTLNQNTTGTAANITASSNSTLTTLSSLSLPGSQVSGNISGNAANVTGVVGVANGGTGLSSTPTNGQLNIGNGTGFTRATLTQGSGITITNGAGSITIAANNSGTVTSVSGTGTVQGLTLSGTVTSSGSLTLGGSLSAVSLTTQVSGTLPIANGGTGATTLAGANIPVTNAANTFTALQTFSGSTSVLAAAFANAGEVATVSATAATGTINFDVTTQSVLYYTSNASANWTVNFRASSGTSLNTAMATGQSVTVAFLVTQGSTAYYNNAVTIDGTSVTPKYQGGTAWAAGNASGIDAYVYTIIKTGAATFTVLASQTQFK